MFNRTTIATEGSDLVGWRQPATSTTLSDHLTVSQSGLYVNDLRGIDFTLIEDGLSNDYSTVNDYLTVVQESEIVSLVYDFMAAAKSKLGSRELLSNFDVTNGPADFTDLSTKNARFVGWLIKPTRSNNIRTIIKKIGLQLNTAETVRIFLYETSQQSAIKTFDFSYTTPLSLQWNQVVDWIVDYRGDYGTNQQYVLGYYEYNPNNPLSYQMTGRAVQYDFDCGCSNSPKRYFGRYVEIQPIEIPVAYHNYSGGEYLLPKFDTLPSFYVTKSYGLFAKVNVGCDITDVLIDNIDVFAKAFQYRVAVRVLGDYLSSLKINTTNDSKRIREVAEYSKNMYESLLHGWSDSTGRYHRGLMEDIVIDFSGIDNVCLPCREDHPKTGYINYR